MNNVETNIALLKEKLFNEPIIKQYFSLKESIENDISLNELKREIIRYTKENKINEANVLKAQYDNHPIVANFNIVKEEVVNLLKEIKEVLE